MSRLIFFAFLVALVVMTSGRYVWRYFYENELARMDLSADQELAQAVDQFQGQISTARALPTLLARSEVVVESIQIGQIGTALEDYLTRAHDLSGAYEIRLLDATGSHLVSTLHNDALQRSSDTDFYRTAMSGALGVAISYRTEEQVRTLTFARSVLGDQSAQIGVIVLDFDLEALETRFRARPYIMMLRDASGTVVFSNRAGLVFQEIEAVPEGEDAAADLVKRAAHITKSTIQQTHVAQVELWRDVPGAPATEPWIVARQNLLPLELEAILLRNSAPARAYANKLTSLFAITVAFVLMSAFAIYQRRRRLMGKLDAEYKLNEELDRRIALRTADLEQAQNQLVQAEKLSALGTMSAGISHELNQPIAAIQNFAFMARRYIGDQNTEATMSNLSDIEKQTERMSRIIRNLRNFARKDDQPMDAVDLTDIIRHAADMGAQRLDRDGVNLTLTNMDQAIIVMGGEVRLQQVMFNLIENAADALVGRDNKQIEISVSQDADAVRVRVLDNGPGLSEPDRVFEPFYTTKSGPNDDGLGLGLSISYGFVEGFGGRLRATNVQGGGACFTLSFPPVRKSRDDTQSTGKT